MKITIVFTLSLLLVGATAAQKEEDYDYFSVQPLSTDEVRDLKAAQKEFEFAQSKYNASVSKVKQSHGESSYAFPPMGSICGEGFNVSVELRGQYALITRTKRVSCFTTMF